MRGPADQDRIARSASQTGQLKSTEKVVSFPQSVSESTYLLLGKFTTVLPDEGTAQSVQALRRQGALAVTGPGNDGGEFMPLRKEWAT